MLQGIFLKHPLLYVYWSLLSNTRTTSCLNWCCSKNLFLFPSKTWHACSLFTDIVIYKKKKLKYFCIILSRLCLKTCHLNFMSLSFVHFRIYIRIHNYTRIYSLLPWDMWKTKRFSKISVTFITQGSEISLFTIHYVRL